VFVFSIPHEKCVPANWDTINYSTAMHVARICGNSDQLSNPIDEETVTTICVSKWVEEFQSHCSVRLCGWCWLFIRESCS